MDGRRHDMVDLRSGMTEDRAIYMPEVEAASPEARAAYEDDLVRCAVVVASEKTTSASGCGRRA